MKYYAYGERNEFDIDELHIYSEEEIIIEYFPYWKARMEKANKDRFISLDNCLDDWIVVNWAWEI